METSYKTILWTLTKILLVSLGYAYRLNLKSLIVKSSFMIYWTEALSKKQNIRYIIKLDDDIWLNLEQLNKFLVQIAEDSDEYWRTFFAGHINKYYCKVERSPEHKVQIGNMSQHFMINKFSELSSNLDVSSRIVSSLSDWILLCYSCVNCFLPRESNV